MEGTLLCLQSSISGTEGSFPEDSSLRTAKPLVQLLLRQWQVIVTCAMAIRRHVTQASEITIKDTELSEWEITPRGPPSPPAWEPKLKVGEPCCIL